MAEDAVFRGLEMLADASGQLSETLRRRHPDIPWAKVTAFRNVFAHGYLTVRRSKVDEIIEHDLPVLKQVVGKERQRAEDA
jgi:uncharacterized protein with HEPN domain